MKAAAVSRSLVIVALLAGLSACSLIPSPLGQPGMGSNELDQLPGPAPKSSLDWPSEKLWHSPRNSYSSNCRDLKIDAYLIRLQQSPHAEDDTQFKDLLVSCAWTGLTASVDFPIDFPAKGYWSYLTTGNPEFDGDKYYVSSLGVGNDSAFLKLSDAADGRVFVGIAATDEATYMFRIIVNEQVDSAVSDEYYEAATGIVLKHMIENMPELHIGFE